MLLTAVSPKGHGATSLEQLAEDREAIAYPEHDEDLLARVGAAVRSEDIVDWLLVKDGVALTSESQRSRWHRESLIRIGRGQAME